MTAMTTAEPEVLDPAAVSEKEAERLSGLSGKTLKRQADKGAKLGRYTVGRRVLFVRKVLVAWVESHALAAAG